MRRLNGLDALRGIAALAVALHHLARAYGREIPPVLPATAVDLFFILSGFVMTRTYEGGLRDGTLSTVRFMALRYRRLFLPLAVGSTFGVMWVLMQFGPSLDIVASYALILCFLPSLWSANCFMLNGPAWSLFEEVTANLLHGAIFAKMSTRAVVALWLAAAATFALTFLIVRPHWGTDFGHIALLFPREISCYLMGILVYRHFGDAPLGKAPMLAISVFPIVMVAAFFSPMAELLGTLVAAPLILRASLSLKPAQWAAWIGALSYPLYATHQPLLGLCRLAGIGPATALAFAIILAALFEASRRKALKPSTIVTSATA